MRAPHRNVKRFQGQRSALLESAGGCIRMVAAKRPMPNIYDVARRARVSLATVSAVLNDSAFVSPDLRRRHCRDRSSRGAGDGRAV